MYFKNAKNKFIVISNENKSNNILINVLDINHFVEEFF